MQFSSGFRGLDIEGRKIGSGRTGEENVGRVGEGNFSRVDGNITLLLGQVSKARPVLVENVVLLARCSVLARCRSARPALSSPVFGKGLRVGEHTKTARPYIQIVTGHDFLARRTLSPQKSAAVCINTYVAVHACTMYTSVPFCVPNGTAA